MKRIYYVIAIFIPLLTVGCEDVVDVDLNEGESRLVIEASIIWKKGTDGKNQQIRISRSTPFYESDMPGVEDAEVLIISKDGQEFNFSSNGNGIYSTSNFDPVIGKQYTLQVHYENELYEATEELKPVVEIDSIVQSKTGGFAGEDYEIKAYYSDPIATEDYYLFKFQNESLFLEIYEDEFTNGNTIFGYFSDEDIERNDEILIEMEGISKAYYDYLFILRSQIGTNQGGPFETMPAMVRGNIVNSTDQENYPFGYFRLSESDQETYTVQ